MSSCCTLAMRLLHPLHLEQPDWLPIYDILPEEAATSKRGIFLPGCGGASPGDGAAFSSLSQPGNRDQEGGGLAVAADRADFCSPILTDLAVRPDSTTAPRTLSEGRVKRKKNEGVPCSSLPHRSFLLVPLAGFEPATNGLGNRCSILLSYRGTSNAVLLTAHIVPQRDNLVNQGWVAAGQLHVMLGSNPMANG